MRRMTAVLFLLLVAIPVVAQSPPLQVPYRQFRLNNGLTVIMHQDKSVPIVATNVWYHVGSANERPGRTGFAHLFEHLMFEGSKNVKEGEFDNLLERAGGNNNGSTTNDRTNYVIDVPSNALELALFLESDRMAYLLEPKNPKRVDLQRDVVKNERRQSYENAPYGMASLEMDRLLWPANHPYNWPVIGEMADLTAASYDDVEQFFKKYYTPSNASLVVAGDIDYDRTKALVEKYFNEVPKGELVEPVAPPAAMLTGVTRKTITDRVTLPRIYLAWLTPRLYAPGDATLDMVSSVLAGGKNSRLYSASCTTCRSRRTSRRISSRPRSAAHSRSWPRRGPARTSSRFSASSTKRWTSFARRLPPIVRCSVRSIRLRRRSIGAWRGSVGSAARRTS